MQGDVAFRTAVLKLIAVFQHQRHTVGQVGFKVILCYALGIGLFVGFPAPLIVAERLTLGQGVVRIAGSVAELHRAFLYISGELAVLVVLQLHLIEQIQRAAGHVGLAVGVQLEAVVDCVVVSADRAGLADGLGGLVGAVIAQITRAGGTAVGLTVLRRDVDLVRNVLEELCLAGADGVPCLLRELAAVADVEPRADCRLLDVVLRVQLDRDRLGTVEVFDKVNALYLQILRSITTVSLLSKGIVAVPGPNLISIDVCLRLGKTDPDLGRLNLLGQRIHNREFLQLVLRLAFKEYLNAPIELRITAGELFVRTPVTALGVFFNTVLVVGDFCLGLGVVIQRKFVFGFHAVTHVRAIILDCGQVGESQALPLRDVLGKGKGHSNDLVAVVKVLPDDVRACRRLAEFDGTAVHPLAAGQCSVQRLGLCLGQVVLTVLIV